MLKSKITKIRRLASPEKANKPNRAKSAKFSRKPYRKELYTIYLFWKSIPQELQKLPDVQLEDLGFDIKDEIFKKIIQIKNKTQFAEVFECKRHTLNEWEQRPEFMQDLKEFSDKETLLKFKSRVDLSFTRKTIKEADAPRVKLWKQLFEDFQEETKVKHGLMLSEILDEADRIRKEREGENNERWG